MPSCGPPVREAATLRAHIAVDRDAAIRSMDAAASAGVGRYVMVSYFGARTDHGVPADNPFFAYAEAKAAADDHLRASDLTWTVLGPSALTLGQPTGRIDVDRDRVGLGEQGGCRGGRRRGAGRGRHDRADHPVQQRRRSDRRGDRVTAEFARLIADADGRTCRSGSRRSSRGSTRSVRRAALRPMTTSTIRRARRCRPSGPARRDSGRTSSRELAELDAALGTSGGRHIRRLRVVRRRDPARTAASAAGRDAVRPCASSASRQ